MIKIIRMVGKLNGHVKIQVESDLPLLQIIEHVLSTGLYTSVELVGLGVTI